MIQMAKKINYLVPEKVGSGTVFEGNHLQKTYLGSALTIRISSNRKVLHCWTSGLLRLSQLCCLFVQITTLSKPKHTHVNASTRTPSKYFFSFSLPLHLSMASSSKQHAVYSVFFSPPFLFNFFPLKRMCASWETDFLGWVLQSSASLKKAGCCQLKRNFLLLIFPSAGLRVTRWPKHPLQGESRGEPLIYHLPC